MIGYMLWTALYLGWIGLTFGLFLIAFDDNGGIWYGVACFFSTVSLIAFGIDQINAYDNRQSRQCHDRGGVLIPAGQVKGVTDWECSR